MNRREFIGWCGVGAIASSLPVALVACAPDRPQSQAGSNGTPGLDGFQVVGTVSELQQDGKILEKQFLAGPLLVVASSPANQTPTAVNPTCTHQGCLVEWQAGAQQFVCPCHGSSYGPEGKVVTGPAPRPLETYPVKVEGDQVLVKAL